jgi:hypothetical protein
MVFVNKLEDKKALIFRVCVVVKLNLLYLENLAGCI